MKTPADIRIADFERIALPHLGSLYGLARSIVHDGSEAEDLVQDTMLKAFRAFDTFERDSNCRAWLSRILVNTYINQYRRAKRARLYVEEARADVEPAEIEPIDDGMGDLATEPERLADLVDDQIRSALLSLPEEYRIVVVMSDLQGMRYQEISEALDIPLGTVRSRLSRGRDKLRRKLSRYAGTMGYATTTNG
jgi:RNA polymerase sigma-70 factor (ECF subfamily)